MKNIFLPIILTLVLVSGCAGPSVRLHSAGDTVNEEIKQHTAAAKKRVDERIRAYHILNKLAYNAGDMCKDVKPSIGVYGWSAPVVTPHVPSPREKIQSDQIKREGRFGRKVIPEHLQRDFELETLSAKIGVSVDNLRSGRVFVVDVVEDSIAAKNGVKVGDEIVGTAPIKILRVDGSEFSPQQFRDSCVFTVDVSVDNNMNAHVQHNNIIINRGAMTFDDDVVAIILGHEMAHRMMNHFEKKIKNSLGGGLLGVLLDVAVIVASHGTVVSTTGMDAGARAGSQVFSQEFEKEADHVGLYVAARAGFDYSKAPDFWRTQAAEHASSISVGYTHPATAERTLVVEQVVEEIDTKIQQGLPLVLPLISQ